MSAIRRVVITGIGAVTPLSSNAEASWSKIINNQSGLGNITIFDPAESPCKIAGEVKYGNEPDQFNPDLYIDPKEQRKMDRFIHFAVAAADQAIKDSGWVANTDEEKYRTGIMMGSGIGGLPAIEKTVIQMKEKGIKKITPFFIPQSLINLASGQISIRHGFMGPNHAVVTACASGAHAIGDSARMIQFGDVDVMVAGGAESAICESGIGGFAALRALSTNFNEQPTKGSRPFDKDRDGFVMGEGAGVIVLEELEHANKRGAKIYAEIVGYGLSGDAYHMTAPESTGRGSTYAMKLALSHAKITPDKIDYINAHGTSTPLGDEIEVGAVKKVFGDHAYKLSMSSTKSAIGHLLGAAGAVEAIFCVQALRDNIAPPTLNLENPSEGCDIDLVANHAKKRKIDYAMSNSFGFGGTNACLILKKYHHET
ncbi:MAG: beta-ketoacyl-ACP synthase II [Rickettsiales bacterium]